MIDWTPDALTWYIDGTALRTKYRNETWNATTNQYHYPQSPARVQLSLWPAGLASNGQGTIDWAGGLVNWDSQYMQNGYYYAMVNEVKVECYNPPAGFSNNFGDKAYYYDSTYGTNNTVCIGNNNTVLASFYATGNDMSENPSASKSASPKGAKSTSSPTATPQTVPGISGGGAQGFSSGSSSSSGGASSSNGNSGASSSSSSNQGSGTSGGGFEQGTASSGTSDAPKSTAVAGSAVALLGFFIACLLV